MVVDGRQHLGAQSRQLVISVPYRCLRDDLLTEHGIVGISGGDGMPTDYEETDMSAAGPCLDPCPADLDGDGLVGTTDLLELLSAWGSTSGPADINSDGAVDVNDLLLLMAAWGGC